SVLQVDAPQSCGKDAQCPTQTYLSRAGKDELRTIFGRRDNLIARSAHRERRTFNVTTTNQRSDTSRRHYAFPSRRRTRQPKKSPSFQPGEFPVGIPSRTPAIAIERCATKTGGLRRTL